MNDPLKDWPELLDAVERLVMLMYRDGTELTRIVVEGRVYPSFRINTVTGEVDVVFKDYEDIKPWPRKLDE